MRNFVQAHAAPKPAGGLCAGGTVMRHIHTWRAYTLLAIRAAAASSTGPAPPSVTHSLAACTPRSTSERRPCAITFQGNSSRHAESQRFGGGPTVLTSIRGGAGSSWPLWDDAAGQGLVITTHTVGGLRPCGGCTEFTRRTQPRCSATLWDSHMRHLINQSLKCAKESCPGSVKWTWGARCFCGPIQMNQKMLTLEVTPETRHPDPSCRSDCGARIFSCDSRMEALIARQGRPPTPASATARSGHSQP